MADSQASPSQSCSLPASIPRKRAIAWTDEAEELLLSTMCDQVDIGKRSENGYKPEAWEVCMRQLKLDLGFECSLSQLKAAIERGFSSRSNLALVGTIKPRDTSPPRRFGMNTVE